jgi:hypothetical protein
MPKHWWLIDPDNPGRRQRARRVREAARELGSEVIYVGHTEKTNTWFALVDIEDPEKENDVYEAIGGRGKLFELLDPDEEPEERRGDDAT